MSVHIYAAGSQPATAYTDDTFDPPMVGGFEPDKMLFCGNCDECWPASQMVVQLYYDGMRLWCAPGQGCNDPARLSAHAHRTFLRRSYAQKARYANKEATP